MLCTLLLLTLASRICAVPFHLESTAADDRAVQARQNWNRNASTEHQQRDLIVPGNPMHDSDEVDSTPHLQKRNIAAIATERVPNFDAECRLKHDPARGNNVFGCDHGRSKWCNSATTYHMHCVTVKNPFRSDEYGPFPCPENHECVRTNRDGDPITEDQVGFGQITSITCISRSKEVVSLITKLSRLFFSPFVRAARGTRRFVGHFSVSGDLSKVNWNFEWLWAPVVNDTCQQDKGLLVNTMKSEDFKAGEPKNVITGHTLEAAYEFPQASAEYCVQGQIVLKGDHQNNILVQQHFSFLSE